MRTPLLTFVLSLLATPLCAQDLRRGIVDADVVVVGRQVGKKAHDDDLTLHRVQVLFDVVGGGGNTAVTVLDWPNLSLHVRPMPRQSRLYCLQDASTTATRLGLPATDGPYYRMVAWSGSNPLIGAEPANDATVRFAQLLRPSGAGVAPAETATGLCTVALGGDATLRLEAAHFLVERPDLRSKLLGLQWNQLLTRATGEVEDVPYKIALAELCAEQRLDGVFDALIVSLGQVTDVDYARTVGRIGKALHGEDAANRIGERLRTAGQPEDRRALLLALGATNTQAALDSLLRMDKKDAAVEAALKEHRSPRAKEALGGKPAARKPQ